MFSIRTNYADAYLSKLKLKIKMFREDYRKKFEALFFMYRGSLPFVHNRTRKKIVFGKIALCEGCGTIFLSLNQNRVGVKSVLGKTML